MTEYASSKGKGFLSEEILKSEILKYYGLEKGYITQIKFKDTEKQRAVYKIESKDELYCLKKVYYSTPDLRFIYSALEWFYRNNIKVPRLLSTKEGGRYVEYKDMLFILTPWIEGEKCSYDNIEHIMEASYNLARMHKVGLNFTPIIGSSNRCQMDSLHSSIEKHYESILHCSNQAFNLRDKFSKVFLDHYETNITMASIALDVASTINTDNLTISLCHLDYVNKNMLFDTSGKLWVIDFDKCSKDYCAHDISYFLRRLLKRNNTRWDIAVALDSLNAYSSIHPLTVDDMKFIFVYLSFPQKYWKISRDYYNNIKKCNKAAFLSLLNKAVEGDVYQLTFLQEFKKVLSQRYKIQLNY